MESLLFAFNALAPLMALATLGYLLWRLGMFSDAFVDTLHRFVFYVALPVLIFRAISTIDSAAVLRWDLIAFSVAMVLVVTVIGFFVAVALAREDNHRPVIAQAFYRGNFMLIGIPLALRLGGDDALTVLIVLNAFVVTLTNILSIVTFQLFESKGPDTRSRMNEMLLSTIKNPLMIALFVGFLALLFRSPWESVTEAVAAVPDTIELVAMTATPMAMIAIGAQFRFGRVRLYAHPVLVASIARMLVVPVAVFVVAWALRGVVDFTGAWPALIALFASPVAVSSVAVTRGLSGNDELASQVVLSSTAVAVVSLFIFISVMRYFALL